MSGSAVSAGTLLLWIVAVAFAQLVVAIAVALWRRHRRRTISPAVAAAAQAPSQQGQWRLFRVVKRAYEDAAQSQCSFYLEPVDQTVLPSFKPGQFLTFQVPVPSANGASEPARMLTRCYSLSDAPNSQYYRVTIKRVPPPNDTAPPGASSNYFHQHVQVGALLRLKPPSGHFVLDTQSTLPVVLIGGGIGITPMVSMLAWLLQAQPARPVHLYYGVRNSRELAFGSWLRAQAATHTNLKLNVVLSQPEATDRIGADFDFAGRIDIDLIRRTLPIGRHQFYVCGPAALMESLVPALQAWGVDEADLHFEAFGPSTVRAHAKSTTPIEGAPSGAVSVEFRRSGRTLPWRGNETSLLDFAERHGVLVDSGCRSGGCGSCRTTVLEGAVVYDNPPDFDLDAGACLLCVGRPVGSIVLDA